MKGWNIYAHSLRLVARNWKEALQIGLVPMLLVVGVFAFLVGGSYMALLQGDTSAIEQQMMEGGFFVTFFLAWIIAMVMGVWIFVNWHRFVLLEEYPTGWMPPFRGGLILGYIGRLILLVLLAMAVMIPVGLVVGLIGGVFQSPALLMLVMIPIYVFLLLAYFRVVLILPAGAVEKPVRIGEAWDATRGATMDFVVLIVAAFIVQVLVQVVVAGALALLPALGIIVAIAVTVFFGLVNVSVLTTLYGHYIEGRPID